MRSFDLAAQRLPQICTLSLVSVLLSGCALGTFQSGDSFSDPTSTPAYTLSGTVHTPTPAPSGSKVRPHISFPAAGATVFLYAAGTSGYGSAATLLAETTTATDGSGSFSFIQNPSHTNSYSSLSNTYSCPSYTFNSPDGSSSTITKDAYIYVVAFGGDTQNNYDATSAQTNTGYALMAALGDCTNAGSLFVDVNEVTTVASVFALAPYISPVYPTATINGGSSATTLVGGALGTSTSYMTAYGAGTNGGYTSTGTKKASAITPLGYTGMVNAFATVNNLVNLASGTAISSFSNTATVGGKSVKVTGTPEQAKLNHIADILAYCVDSSNSGTSTVSTQCSTLFGYAKPPISSNTTSLNSVSFSAATDTLQAAYYLATNPTDNTTYGATTAGTSSNLYNLFSLVTANADYQPDLSTQPSDWTLSIAYNSTSTCGTGPSAFLGAQLFTAAVDLNGNVAVTNGYTSNDTLVELSNTGTPLLCLLGADANGRDAVFDIYGNLWESLNEPNGIYSYNGSTLTQWPVYANVSSSQSVGTSTSTDYSPYALTADGSGNIFYSLENIDTTTTPSPTAADPQVQEFEGAAATPTTPEAAVLTGTVILSGTYTENLYYLTTDKSGNVFASATVGYRGDGFYEYAYGGTAGNYTRSATGSATETGIYGMAIDGNGYLTTVAVGGTTPGLYKLNASGTTVEASNVTAGAAGLNSSRSVAIDGAGNVWVSNDTATSGTGSSQLYSLAEFDNTSTSTNSINPISPASLGYEKSTLGPSRGMAIDISGNVWVPSDLTGNSVTNSYVVEIIGAAVPTVPLAVAARDSKLATKP